jgi:hypothetical protein
MAISSLEEEDVEVEAKSDEKPSVLSVILKVPTYVCTGK